MGVAVEWLVVECRTLATIDYFLAGVFGSLNGLW